MAGMSRAHAAPPTTMSDLRLSLASLLPKVSRRFPARLANLALWVECRDWLRAGHYLAAPRRLRLERARRACNGADDMFDFAQSVFPAHQIRSEILAFLALARDFRPKTVLEIGTADGGTQFLLGSALPEATLVLGLDLFVQNRRLLRHFGRPGCRQEFVDGSSHSAATADRIRGILDERRLDVLFIDGDHTLDGVRDDFERYAPFVRPGGLVAFHDIVPDHRTRYGRNTGRYSGDVPKFWQEIRGTFPRTWEFIADPGQDGLGIGVGCLA
jgi:predicted O-methyltransferase YrrM